MNRVGLAVSSGEDGLVPDDRPVLVELETRADGIARLNFQASGVSAWNVPATLQVG
jgi:hypothetical protein